MQDNKNFFLAIALSMIVLIGWNVFFGMPSAERQRQEAQVQSQTAGQGTPGQTAPAGSPNATAIPDLTLPGAPAATRDGALAASARVIIDSARVRGSIALRGGDIDDIALKDYHETVDRSSPNVVVFSPANGPGGYFARFGWLPAAGAAAGDVPGPQTVWTADRQTLTEKAPVTLSWDNGKGLLFKRAIAIDENFMLSVVDSVENKGQAAANLTPYGLIRRIGTPHVEGYYILHEGLIGVLGEQGLSGTHLRQPRQGARARPERARPALRRGHRRLVRHHRQILGLRARAGPDEAFPGVVHGDDRSRRGQQPCSAVLSDPDDPAARGRRAGRHRQRHATGCSPAPRRSRRSTATRRSSASRTSSC